MGLVSKGPTIHDLAADLNISATTVWRAINNRDRVSAVTRERVRARAKELNYEPSLVAQNLSHGRTSTLGVLVPRIGNMVFSRLVETVEQVAFERGYCVILCNLVRRLGLEVEYTRMLYRRRVEGVVVVPFGPKTREWDKILEDLENKGVAVVLLEQTLQSSRFSTVVADNYGASYEMTQHLIRLGHTRLAFVSSTSDNEDVNFLERLEGFKQAVAHAGLNDKARLLLDVYEKADDGSPLRYSSKEIKECLSGPDRPTGIFTLTDTLAIQVMGTIREMNLNIPRDVAVAGFDNIDFAEYTVPPLTTMEHPTEQMARRAAEMLFEKIEAGSSATKEPALERLPCKMIIRKSCGAYLLSQPS
jgi:DNA-binding LacI/PurR family transcriptional regulator